jgi:hypothetical protein
MSAGKDGNSSQGSFIGCRISQDPLKGTPVAVSPGSQGSFVRVLLNVARGERRLFTLSN